jgi:hypothetical protein
MEALAGTVEETAQGWEQDGGAAGAVREMLGAVDETFLERMMRVVQAGPPGYMRQEAVADERTYATWKALGDERLKARGTSGVSLVSDRAKALIQRAAQGCECLSRPDFFPFMHDMVQCSALAMARQVRQAHQALRHVEAGLARHAGRTDAEPDRAVIEAEVEAKRADVQRWEAVQRTYRPPLETRARTLPPCGIADAAPQTSAQVHGRLQAAVDALAALAACHQWPHRHAALQKVRTQFPALAAWVDWWWEGVQQHLEPLELLPMGRRWAMESLVPLVSWGHQAAQTRCAGRKAKMRRRLEAVRAAFQQHAITRRMPPQGLEEWHGWATQRVQALQRASSAVEGRNGSRSHRQHNPRGVPKPRSKVWTVLHTFDCHAADGTTPAVRFFRRSFPDLFETVLSTIDALPRPRKRHQAMALTEGYHKVSRFTWICDTRSQG